MKPLADMKHKYQPKSNLELKDLVEDLSIKLYEIGTSLITDMNWIFYNSKRTKNKDFEGIETWDTSNVTDMCFMFRGCENFNQPLNSWNVSKVKNMSYMFCDCKKFNQNINNWNVSNVIDMYGLFHNCKNFNQPLNNWDISNVENMSCMFYKCQYFNQPLNTWDISNIDDKYWMFDYCNIKEEYKPKGANNDTCN